MRRTATIGLGLALALGLAGTGSAKDFLSKLTEHSADITPMLQAAEGQIAALKEQLEAIQQSVGQPHVLVPAAGDTQKPEEAIAARCGGDGRVPFDVAQVTAQREGKMVQVWVYRCVTAEP